MSSSVRRGAGPASHKTSRACEEDLSALRPGTPEVKVYKAVAFLQNLPREPQPLPEIDDRIRPGAWYEMSYPIQYLLPFIAALEDAGPTLSPPEK